MCDYTEFLRYPIDDSFKLFGKERAGPVLMELFRGTDRFNTLLKTLPGISPRTLSMRLDDLERAGLAQRVAKDSSSRRIRYRLTSKGEDMRRLVREIASFSLRWFGENAQEMNQFKRNL
ncbi:MAG TPA: helix-turn-helix domain-containing protein [Candidatus Bathyarchaeia archaeon]|nr:helix-turn-helix domain-containing protein [Candidatus Bathyarchaeia archaeon]